MPVRTTNRPSVTARLPPPLMTPATERPAYPLASKVAVTPLPMEIPRVATRATLLGPGLEGAVAGKRDGAGRIAQGRVGVDVDLAGGDVRAAGVGIRAGEEQGVRALLFRVPSVMVEAMVASTLVVILVRPAQVDRAAAERIIAAAGRIEGNARGLNGPGNGHGAGRAVADPEDRDLAVGPGRRARYPLSHQLVVPLVEFQVPTPSAGPVTPAPPFQVSGEADLNDLNGSKPAHPTIEHHPFLQR